MVGSRDHTQSIQFLEPSGDVVPTRENAGHLFTSLERAPASLRAWAAQGPTLRVGSGRGSFPRLRPRRFFSLRLRGAPVVSPRSLRSRDASRPRATISTQLVPEQARFLRRRNGRLIDNRYVITASRRRRRSVHESWDLQLSATAADRMNLTHDAGHREPRPAEHPGAGNPVADTLDRWTLGPVKRCHEPTCLAPNYGKSPGLSRRPYSQASRIGN
jgi:hypothetical protein